MPFYNTPKLYFTTSIAQFGVALAFGLEVAGFKPRPRNTKDEEACTMLYLTIIFECLW